MFAAPKKQHTEKEKKTYIVGNERLSKMSRGVRYRGPFFTSLEAQNRYSRALACLEGSHVTHVSNDSAGTAGYRGNPRQHGAPIDQGVQGQNLAPTYRLWPSRQTF
jgi:hypothetical protein